MVRPWATFRPALLVFLCAVLALGSALMLAPGRASPPVNPACPAPQSIPTGFDYPQPAAAVEQWVKRGDVGRTRLHGWNLWAALNQPSPPQDTAAVRPVWQSWCTETQAFASSNALLRSAGRAPGARPMRQFKFNNGLRTGPDPINFPVAPFYAVPQPVLTKYKNSSCIVPATPTSPATLANGPTLQNNGDVMVAGVIYNKPAFDWIRSTGVYQAGTLKRMMPPPGGIGSIPNFPAGAISLKPMMWPVQASGFTALPVWDDPSSDDGVYAGFEIQNKWPRAVAVTPSPQSTLRPQTVSFLHGVTMAGQALGPNTYTNASVVGIEQFYHYRPNLATMAACDRAILDASAYYAYGRLFQQGDYLVLVAMHIMTKEQAAWTFQSVWWHDRPDVGPYAADRPKGLAAQGPWAHYLMAATYGIPAASPRGLAQWPVAFNPYIELAAAHPIRTNCMNCHHRAAWPAQTDEYQATGGPGALDVFSQDNKVIFANKVQVDSLWSISDRVPSPPGAPKSPPTKP